MSLFADLVPAGAPSQPSATVNKFSDLTPSTSKAGGLYSDLIPSTSAAPGAPVSHAIPSKLGGGSFSSDPNDPNKLVQTDKNYAGEKGVHGSERDHIVPWELGGESKDTNLQIQPGKPNVSGEAGAKDKVENYFGQQFRQGKISLNAARTAVLNWRDTEIPGQKAYNKNLGQSDQGVGNIALNTVKGMFVPNADTNKTISDTTGKAGDYVNDKLVAPYLSSNKPLVEPGTLGRGEPGKPGFVPIRYPQVNLPGKGVVAPLAKAGSDIQNTIANTVTDSFNRTREFSHVLSDPKATLAEKFGAGIKAVTGTALVAISPILAGFKALSEIPGVNIASDTAMLPIAAAGVAIPPVVGAAIDKLPISDNTKQALKGPVQEAATLLAQIGVGAGMAKASGLFENAIVDKTNSALKIDSSDISPEHAKEIIQSAAEDVKTELTKPFVEAPKTPETAPTSQEVPPKTAPGEGIAPKDVETPVKWFRGENENGQGIVGKKLGLPSGDKFFTNSPSQAKDYAGEGGKVITPDELPKNPLVISDKKSLANEMGYKGNPTGKPVQGQKSFDDLAKEYAKSKGHDGIIYNKLSTAEGYYKDAPQPQEMHLFKQETPQSEVISKAEEQSKNQDAIPQDVLGKRGSTTLKEIKGTGDVKTRGLAKSVESSAIQDGLAKSLGDLPEYKTVDMGEQAKMTTDMITKDPLQAKRIAMGEQVPPKGMIAEAMYTSMRIKASAEGDVQTMLDLTKSKLVGQATTMGQRIAALRGANPEDPVAAIKEVQAAREADAQARLKNESLPKAKERISKQVDDTIEKVKSAPRPKTNWGDMVASIQC